MDEQLDFKCSECGSEELIVVYDYEIRVCYRHYLPCECENGEEVAAEIKTYSIDAYTQEGILQEDHRWDWEETEHLGDVDHGEEYSQVFCRNCLEDAGQVDWQVEEEDEREIEDEEFYVRCGGCDREVEFGWSHPDRGGRIWPAESKDFNPWKCWPEPRYLESWEKKGWLRPV